MDESKRLRSLAAVFLALCVTAGVVWWVFRPGVKPPPSAPGYYTGPMRSKGDPNVFGTDEGVRVPPPASSQPIQAANRPPARGIASP